MSTSCENWAHAFLTAQQEASYLRMEALLQIESVVVVRVGSIQPLQMRTHAGIGQSVQQDILCPLMVAPTQTEAAVVVLMVNIRMKPTYRRAKIGQIA